MPVYDCAIIGAGPGGIFAALQAAQRGKDVILFEKGGSFACSICPHYEQFISGGPAQDICCSNSESLSGFGGSALHFEVTLDNYPRNPSFEFSSTLLDHFGTATRVKKHVNQVYDTLFEHGLDKETFDKWTRTSPLEFQNLVIEPTGSVPVTFEKIRDVLTNLHERLESEGVQICFNTEITDIQQKKQDKYQVISQEIDTTVRKIVFATGKFKSPVKASLLSDFDVTYTDPEAIYLGARVELPREWLADVLEGYKNPKIWSHDESARTFCFCDGGRMMRYEVDGVPVLDGEHAYSNKGDKTNFAIIKKIPVPEEVTSTELTRTYSKDFVVLTEDNTLPAQRYYDLREGIASDDEEIRDTNPTLQGLSGANLKEVLANYDINARHFLELLSNDLKREIPDETVITGPVVQKRLPRISLDRTMQSSNDDMYFVGDCSGVVGGVISAATTGVVAGDHI